MASQFLLLRLDGSKTRGETNCLPENRLLSGDIGKFAMRLIIGSNLLSVGVKWYLISRMASKAGSHLVLPSPLPLLRQLRAAILHSLTVYPNRGLQHYPLHYL